MKSIIIFNSMTGNTESLAYKMKEVLESSGHQCDIYRDDRIYLKVRNDLEFFKSYDLLCFGSCTHALSPAISFQTFLRRVKRHKLKEKKLLCFATSANSNNWEITCQKIQKMFPQLEHIGNFGCTQRNYEQILNEFKKIIIKLK
ncbi:MAG: flavodoxin family protein [Candidatus Hodarchaeota archaeon]